MCVQSTQKHFIYLFIYNTKSASNSELSILNIDDCIPPCLSAPVMTDYNWHPQFPWYQTADT